MNSFNFTEHNNLMNRCQEHINRGKIAAVTINDVNLICYENGDIYRRFKNIGYKLIENKVNDGNGYNQVNCNGKMILRHRIISHAFLNLDIGDFKQHIDHIDHNRINNSINNLRIVTPQQNQFNQEKALGYTWNNQNKKYQAQIVLNKKLINLGLYDTKKKKKPDKLILMESLYIIELFKIYFN